MSHSSLGGLVDTFVVGPGPDHRSWGRAARPTGPLGLPCVVRVIDGVGVGCVESQAHMLDGLIAEAATESQAA